MVLGSSREAACGLGVAGDRNLGLGCRGHVTNAQKQRSVWWYGFVVGGQKMSREAQASPSRERGLLHICSTLKYGSNEERRLMAEASASYNGALRLRIAVWGSGRYAQSPRRPSTSSNRAVGGGADVRW